MWPDLKVSSHCLILRQTPRPIENGLYRIVWKCSHQHRIPLDSVQILSVSVSVSVSVAAVNTVIKLVKCHNVSKEQSVQVQYTFGYNEQIL